MYEKKDVENFENNEEGITCDDKAMVEFLMELETELTTLEDEVPREVSMIETSIDEHFYGATHDALMSHLDTIHDDDAPHIEKSVAQTYAWS